MAASSTAAIRIEPEMARTSSVPCTSPSRTDPLAVRATTGPCASSASMLPLAVDSWSPAIAPRTMMLADAPSAVTWEPGGACTTTVTRGCLPKRRRGISTERVVPAASKRTSASASSRRLVMSTDVSFEAAATTSMRPRGLRMSRAMDCGVVKRWVVVGTEAPSVSCGRSR